MVLNYLLSIDSAIPKCGRAPMSTFEWDIGHRLDRPRHLPVKGNSESSGSAAR